MGIVENKQLVLDFYEADFGEQLAALDRGVPYVIYCRSGNRSGETREMMIELGFTDVANVAGGINAWSLEIDSSVPTY